MYRAPVKERDDGWVALCERVHYIMHRISIVVEKEKKNYNIRIIWNSVLHRTKIVH